jgi:small conductance mechanosensitive channel
MGNFLKNVVRVSICFVLAVSCLLGHFAMADEWSGDEDELAARGGELVAQIVRDREEIRQLEVEAEQSEGEDRLVAERRFHERRLEVLQSFNELVDNIVSREDAGGAAEDERHLIEEVLGGSRSQIQEYIVEKSRRLAELRAKQASLRSAGMLGVERRIARQERSIDFALEILYDVTSWMERLGLDPSEERTYLVEILTQRADELAARTELAMEDEDALRDRSANDPDNTELSERLRAVKERRKTGIESLADTVDLMKPLDLDSAKYRELLVRATGQVTTDVLSTDVALTIFRRWWQGGREWVVENGPALLFRLLLVVLILLVFRVMAGLARRVTRRGLEHSKLNISQLLHSLIVRVSFNAVMLVGLLLGLSQLGVSLGPLLAGFGVAGLIIGFALQDTLGNFASGMMILLYRPFDVDDLVEAAGVFGTVRNMSLVSTTILTLDNQTIVVPNNKIWGDVIKNVTAQKTRRVDMVFGISYADDIPNAEKALKAILDEHDKVLDDPWPLVRLHKLGESSVDFVVRPWAKTEDYWDVYWDVTREVKMRFDRERISIPFPQREVRLIKEDQDYPESRNPASSGSL